jgi:hypothetical protein
MSHIKQHNLHIAYREILNKHDRTARLYAFADLIEELSGEELHYVDSLLERDIVEMLPDEGLDRVESLLHFRITRKKKSKGRSAIW